jgi:hypothetical protein
MGHSQNGKDCSEFGFVLVGVDTKIYDSSLYILSMDISSIIVVARYGVLSSSSHLGHI